MKCPKCDGTLAKVVVKIRPDRREKYFLWRETRLGIPTKNVAEYGLIRPSLTG